MFDGLVKVVEPTSSACDDDATLPPDVIVSLAPIAPPGWRRGSTLL